MNEIREGIFFFFFYLGNWLTGSGLHFSSFFFFFFPQILKEINIDEIQSVAKVFIYLPLLEKEAYFEKCDFDEISRVRRACNGLCIYRAIYFFDEKITLCA